MSLGPPPGRRSRPAGPLLVPSPVLGEIGYLLQSRVGAHAEVTFLKSFGGNGFHVAEVGEGDISRIAELVEQYVSLPLGIVTTPSRSHQPETTSPVHTSPAEQPIQVGTVSVPVRPATFR